MPSFSEVKTLVSEKVDEKGKTIMKFAFAVGVAAAGTIVGKLILDEIKKRRS